MIVVNNLRLRWCPTPVQFARHTHHMSAIFRPVHPISAKSKGVTGEGTQGLSVSQKLMIENGLIRPSSTGGTYSLLPIAVKSLEKLVKIIDHFMVKYSCQKIQMPTLTATSLWKETGRLDECGKEIFSVKDRHSKEFLLSPTHEEAVCEILGDFPWSYKNLPLRLYQITNKFRDEMKPRFGLLRTREFLMKDLYTFDVDERSAQLTYEVINEAYRNIFDALGVEYLKVEGTTGIIGGSLSHEYHLTANIGEDKLVVCRGCNFSFNEQLFEASKPEGESPDQRCPKCKSSHLKKHSGIEVGHTFLLGQKYSKILQTKYLNSSGEPNVMEMGCYGIGVTRLLAGVLEVLSVENQLRWPSTIAPYKIAILPPKLGSKEEPIGNLLADEFLKYSDLLFPNDVLVDDRTDLTIGKRLLDIKKLGIPYVLVFGKSLTEKIPLIEVVNVNSGEASQMNIDEAQTVLAQLRGISTEKQVKDRVGS